MVQGAAIFIYIAAPCTTEIHTENQRFILRVKTPVQPRFLHLVFSFSFSCFLLIPKNKNSPELFPFFVPNSYICTSSKSRAKQRKETRTATKSLPVTELPALYVLSINRLKKTRCFFDRGCAMSFRMAFFMCLSVGRFRCRFVFLF